MDYYREMILLDMSSLQSPEKGPSPWQELRYVPLSVDTVPVLPGDPEDPYFGRGPRMSRSVCAMSDGVKFVSVDCQRCSSFRAGHAGRLRWKQQTFRITTWSLARRQR